MSSRDAEITEALALYNRATAPHFDNETWLIRLAVGLVWASGVLFGFWVGRGVGP